PRCLPPVPTRRSSDLDVVPGTAVREIPDAADASDEGSGAVLIGYGTQARKRGPSKAGSGRFGAGKKAAAEPVAAAPPVAATAPRSEEHTSELQSRENL